MIRLNQRPVEGLRAAGCCALQPHLLESIDALVQVVNAHYAAYRRVLGRCQCCKKETAEKTAEQHDANQYNMVSGSPPDLFRPYC